MAKKVRRVRRPVQKQDKKKPQAEPEQTVDQDLREEYAYVLKDLRRVFILAAFLFALLIAINLLMG